MIRRFGLFLAAVLVTLFSPIAFAQVAPAPAGPAGGIAMWAPLVAVLLAGFAYSLRNFTPTTGWLHTGLGHFAITLLTAALGGAAGAIAAHGFSEAAIIMAVSGAIGGAFGAANPSLQPKSSGGAALLPLLILPMLFCSGCAHVAMNASNIAAGFLIFCGLSLALGMARALPRKSTARSGVGAPSKISLLLPFVIIVGAFAPGCPSMSGQAFEKCELGALPNAAEPVIAAVITIATNTASTVSDLVALAEQVGPQQVACAAQAYQAWLTSRQPVGARLLVAAEQPFRQHALAVLGAYLAEHPAQACTGRARL